jgi:hypothetical protein
MPASRDRQHRFKLGAPLFYGAGKLPLHGV